MTMSYATEDQKGLYTTVFWVIFNAGAMIGGLMTFGLEFNSEIVGVSAVSYFTFCVLMVIGAVLGLVLVGMSFLCHGAAISRSACVCAESVKACVWAWDCKNAHLYARTSTLSSDPNHLAMGELSCTRAGATRARTFTRIRIRAYKHDT